MHPSRRQDGASGSAGEETAQGDVDGDGNRRPLEGNFRAESPAVHALLPLPEKSLDLTLLAGGEVFSPKPLGKRDLLFGGGRIVAVLDVDEGLSLRKACRFVRYIENGLSVVPGLVDIHVHATGGGGEAGPSSMIQPSSSQKLMAAGTTTIVGVLGTDGIARSPEALVAKCRGLEAEGMTAFFYTGSYAVPPRTVTESVEKDIMMIDRCIGVGEVALSDPRGSYPTVQQMAELGSAVYRAGLLSGKKAIVHCHMGGEEAGLIPVFEALKGKLLPARVFLPTHMSRTPGLVAQARELVKMGGHVDLTGGKGTAEVIDGWLKEARSGSGGIDVSKVSISSDCYGSLPKLDPETGEVIGYDYARPTSLLKTLSRLMDGGVGSRGCDSVCDLQPCRGAGVRQKRKN